MNGVSSLTPTFCTSSLVSQTVSTNNSNNVDKEATIISSLNQREQTNYQQGTSINAGVLPHDNNGNNGNNTDGNMSDIENDSESETNNYINNEHVTCWDVCIIPTLNCSPNI